MIATSRLVILGESDVRAHELFSVRDPDERSKLEKAIEFLTDELCAEWRPKPELDAAATVAGVAARTLARARKRLGVEVRREGFPSITQWRLAVVPSTVGTTGAPGVGTTAKPPINTDASISTDPQSCHTVMVAQLNGSDGEADALAEQAGT